MNGRVQRIGENTVYYLIWAVIFLVTVVGFRENGAIRWHELGLFWLRSSPFFLLFLIHNYLLLPRFFLRKKYGLYTALALLMVLIIMLMHVAMFRHFREKFPPHGAFPGDRPVREFAQPQVEGPHPGDTALAMELPVFEVDMSQPRPPRPFPFVWGLILNKLLLALLLVGFNIAVALIFKMIHDAREMERLEKQNLRAELDYLKAQINPHFFMNTLNNIHALVDIDTERAKDTIIELSKIMRYVLYETDKPLVSLRQEVKFIDNYLSLMGIRYSENVSIQTSYPQDIPDAKVPPLMLVTLIENAFKHGISYRHESFIKVELTIQGARLLFTVRNSRHDNGTNPPKSLEKESGMGLENMRKRLSLLYGENYRLRLAKRPLEYTALLEIPMEK